MAALLALAVVVAASVLVAFLDADERAIPRALLGDAASDALVVVSFAVWCGFLVMSLLSRVLGHGPLSAPPGLELELGKRSASAFASERRRASSRRAPRPLAPHSAAAIPLTQ